MDEIQRKAKHPELNLLPHFSPSFQWINCWLSYRGFRSIFAIKRRERERERARLSIYLSIYLSNQSTHTLSLCLSLIRPPLFTKSSPSNPPISFYLLLCLVFGMFFIPMSSCSALSLSLLYPNLSLNLNLNLSFGLKLNPNLSLRLATIQSSSHLRISLSLWSPSFYPHDNERWLERTDCGGLQDKMIRLLRYVARAYVIACLLSRARHCHKKGHCT